LLEVHIRLLSLFVLRLRPAAACKRRGKHKDNDKKDDRNDQNAKIRSCKVPPVDVVVVERKDDERDQADQGDGKQDLIPQIRPWTERFVLRRDRLRRDFTALIIRR